MIKRLKKVLLRFECTPFAMYFWWVGVLTFLIGLPTATAIRGEQSMSGLDPMVLLAILFGPLVLPYLFGEVLERFLKRMAWEVV